VKILAICGSPRKGNTEAMLKRILDGAKEEGAQIELILLREKNIEPCKGFCDCYGRGTSCTIPDDMNTIISKMISADLIIFGSPDYFKNVTGIMKNLMDRTNPIVKKEMLANKKAFIVCTGGQNLKNIAFCERALKEFAKDHKMKIAGSIKETAEKPTDAAKNEKLMKKCFETGKEIAASGKPY
jgi:multimeric flavodoxin WrbA